MSFAPPDFSSPLSLVDELAAFESSDHCKGVILGNVADQLRRQGHSTSAYTLFRDYPMHEYIRLCVGAAEALFPDEPVKEGLRRIGHGHYDAFKNTTLGRMVFGVLGRNMTSVLKASPKGYRYTTNTSRTRIESLDKVSREAVVRLLGLPFLDSLQVGVYEGGVQSTGHTSEVHVARDDAPGLLLRIRWV